MSEASHQKAILRRELRRRRQSLSTEQQAEAADAVSGFATRVPAWTDARNLAVYLPADGEIDTAPLVECARAAGKSLHLPVIRPDDSLVFALWHPAVRLIPNRYGIPEPPEGSALCNAEQLDMIFLPLVGWDLSGGRLGMGGGFYDRTLERCAGPVLVGLAHACQQVEAVPGEDWDVRLDYVATGTALYRCRE